MSHLVQEARKKHGWDLQVIIASNGDAALATACTSKALSSPCTVFVTRDASQDLIKSLKLEEAIVVVGGDTDSEALEQAKAAAAANPHAYVSRTMLFKGFSKSLIFPNTISVLIPAGDDQVLWNECESMISEIREDLDFIPDVIFCTARRGLLGGIITGCDRGWGHGAPTQLSYFSSHAYHQCSPDCCNRTHRIERVLFFHGPQHVVEGNVSVRRYKGNSGGYGHR